MSAHTYRVKTVHIQTRQSDPSPDFRPHLGVCLDPPQQRPRLCDREALRMKRSNLRRSASHGELAAVTQPRGRERGGGVLCRVRRARQRPPSILGQVTLRSLLPPGGWLSCCGGRRHPWLPVVPASQSHRQAGYINAHRSESCRG